MFFFFVSWKVFCFKGTFYAWAAVLISAIRSVRKCGKKPGDTADAAVHKLKLRGNKCIPTGSAEAEENPSEVLRSLFKDEQGLEELMSYTPQGHSETILEYFRFGNTSHFKQKMGILCAHLLHGCDVRKIYLLLWFDNPGRFRLNFDYLKWLLLPFCREFRTMLFVANRRSFDGQIIFTLSDNGMQVCLALN